MSAIIATLYRLTQSNSLATSGYRLGPASASCSMSSHQIRETTRRKRCVLLLQLGPDALQLDAACSIVFLRSALLLVVLLPQIPLEVFLNSRVVSFQELSVSVELLHPTVQTLVCNRIIIPQIDPLLPWKRDFVSLACFGDVVFEIRQHGIVAYRAFFFGIDSDALLRQVTETSQKF